MYNKLFAKILDSSIWLEDDKTRLVWITMIASMDEDGMVQMASISNLARRAAVSLEDARRAVEVLEKADPESSDPENDGRRVERVPGGWIVLNALKYREQVTREDIRRKTRLRVQRFRDNHKDVTQKALQNEECNADSVTEALQGPGCNAPVTPSVSVSGSVNTYVEDSFDGGDQPTLESLPSSSPRASKDADREAVKRVFAYYLVNVGRSATQYTLTKARMQKGLTCLEECKRRFDGDMQKAETAMGRAVDGLVENRFLMGENDRHRQYVEWESHVFKSVEVMEKRWIDAGGLNV